LKLIDLHVHSTASDGSFTPAEVTALAREAGLTAIALTDHDTVSGVGEALAAAGDFPLEVVPGVELSCLYKERSISWGCILTIQIKPSWIFWIRRK